MQQYYPYPLPMGKLLTLEEAEQEAKERLKQHIMSQSPVRELNVQVYDDPRTGKVVKVEGVGFDLKEIGKVITKAEDARDNIYQSSLPREPERPLISEPTRSACRDCQSQSDDYIPFYPSDDGEPDPQDFIIDAAFRPDFTRKNKVTLDAMLDLIQKYPEVATKLINLAKK